MYKILFFLLLSFPSFANEVYFSPSSKCENSIVDFINKSQSTIDAAVYSINNKRIVFALKKAHKRGVKIRILTDRYQASSKNSKVKDIYKYGINIRVHSKYKIEHNKFAVFDSKYATSGSYNWTNPASKKNSENCLFFIRNKKIVNSYQKRFDYLWKINTKEKSDNFFSKKFH